MTIVELENLIYQSALEKKILAAAKEMGYRAEVKYKSCGSYQISKSDIKKRYRYTQIVLGSSVAYSLKYLNIKFDNEKPITKFDIEVDIVTSPKGAIEKFIKTLSKQF